MIDYLMFLRMCFCDCDDVIHVLVDHSVDANVYIASCLAQAGACLHSCVLPEGCCNVQIHGVCAYNLDSATLVGTNSMQIDVKT